ncbi:hypothetical protein KK083_07900 [Fulvivirgaceae bacterium PWU4]|uniref:DUF5675 domain-containing protein n=1 Tax=Chryseosolibacter histidini TaxID=2782349 RepID=A0AAP2DI76_9BACT|nr:DUF5675 family protein [Chryseosolibacter histidini]MBT1696791.1 hypothetical protein [Chryseosolibacter histidini]
MNRIILLIFIGLVTFIIIMILNNTTFGQDFWIYLVGLAGLVVKGFRSAANWVKGLVTANDGPQTPAVAGGASVSGFQRSPAAPVVPAAPASSSPPSPPPPPSPSTMNFTPPAPAVAAGNLQAEDFAGLQMMLLRYVDDGQTTLGMLFVDNKYFSMTLEDTYHETKIKGQTRIPAGTYEIRFQPALTDLTKKYRERFPDWFTNHIELQNVPGYVGIYIHSGGNHKHTEGCLLVSDAYTLGAEGPAFKVSDSNETFKKLYLRLSAALTQGQRVRITIKDENWIANLKAN